jgi:hypothetical protein
VQRTPITLLIAALLSLALAVPVTAADEPASTSDLLPGVDLVTEEVSPGVFRVLSDGERNLRRNVWDVAVSPEGGVWVLKYADWQPGGVVVIEDLRVLRLGDPDGTRFGRSVDAGLVTRPEGTIVLSEEERRRVFDGKRWTRWRPTPEQRCQGAWADGVCWTPTLGEGYVFDGARRTDPSGQQRSYSAEDIGLGPDEHPGTGLVASGDGRIWLSAHHHGDDGPDAFAGLVTYDGESWSRVDAPPARTLRFADLALDADGVVWLAAERDGSLVLHAWDGKTWSSYETSDYRFAPHSWVSPDGGGGKGCCEPNLRFADDGTLWIGKLTRFDGSNFQVVEGPTIGGSTRPDVLDAEHAPDGSIWMVVGEHEQRTDGLYVITPEAVAATTLSTASQTTHTGTNLEPDHSGVSASERAQRVRCSSSVQSRIRPPCVHVPVEAHAYPTTHPAPLRGLPATVDIARNVRDGDDQRW